MNRALLVLALLAIPTAARAEQLELDAFVPHVNVGFEGSGGGDTVSALVRTHIGASKSFGNTHWRPSIGIGATFGYGLLSVTDPRALDGSVDIGYLDYGPELQVGMRIGNGGMVDNRVFASFAYLKTDLDDRLMLDAVGNVGGTRGMRMSIGASWADRMGNFAARSDSKEDDYNWVIMLLPQQVELGWERSAGSDRLGVTLSYGI
ncbi:MAG: hypothetical protein ABI867_35405 [Kofleriaceae bacterium]